MSEKLNDTQVSNVAGGVEKNKTQEAADDTKVLILDGPSHIGEIGHVVGASFGVGTVQLKVKFLNGDVVAYYKNQLADVK